LKPVLVQAVARRELRDSTAWYRERNHEVADRFVREVQRTMELIETFPATGSQIPLVTGKARRLPVAGFPYHVVYRHFTSVLQFKVEPKTAS
jgi:plasmid stabilization system protein ParE